jgi:hypothetical protein
LTLEVKNLAQEVSLLKERIESDAELDETRIKKLAM